MYVCVCVCMYMYECVPPPVPLTTPPTTFPHFLPAAASLAAERALNAELTDLNMQLRRSVTELDTKLLECANALPAKRKVCCPVYMHLCPWQV